MIFHWAFTLQSIGPNGSVIYFVTALWALQSSASTVSSTAGIVTYTVQTYLHECTLAYECYLKSYTVSYIIMITTSQCHIFLITNSLPHTLYVMAKYKSPHKSFSIRHENKDLSCEIVGLHGVIKSAIFKRKCRYILQYLLYRRILYKVRGKLNKTRLVCETLMHSLKEMPKFRIKVTVNVTRPLVLMSTLGPVPFGTCICSNVETILSWTCHVYGPFEFRTSLGTSIFLEKRVFASNIHHVVLTVPRHISVLIRSGIHTGFAFGR